jgi:branched-chain amino acid transport system substrate-binding protein
MACRNPFSDTDSPVEKIKSIYKKMNKSNKTIWWVVGVIVVIGLVWWGIGRQSASGNTIKVGVIVPLTGDVSSMGTIQKAAVQVAVDEVNAAGGINGKQIQMFYEDGQCNAQAAVSAAQKLISVDNVMAILGGTCTTETAAFGPMAMQNKIIVMSPSASAPALSKLGKYFFRDYPSDSFQGKFAAQYVYQKLGARKVAILYHNDDYGVGLKDVFTQSYQELGGQIVDAEGAPQTDTDYRTALTKIKGSNPDAIYAPTYPDGAKAFLTQSATLGIKVPFLGPDSWDDPSLQKAVSGAGNFFYTLPAQSVIPQDIQTKIFAITKGTQITAGVANDYDNVKILAAAIAKVGTDPDRLADAIRATQYAGISGQIAFDQNGDLTTATYQVKQIKNGGAVVVPQ